MIISSKVPDRYNNKDIVEFLTERFDYHEKWQWIKKIKQGKILYNNVVANLSQHVKTGDIIGYDMGDVIEPPADLNYSIIYEDQWILGINKTGNLLVHHQGKSFTSNLIYQLRHVHEPSFPKAGIVNRLDRETSGVVIVAKYKEPLVAMNRLLTEQKFEKEYIAIVHGCPEPEQGTISFPIGKMDASKISYRYCINGTDAKNSVTRYIVLKKLNNGFSVLKLFPQTGRTHQIRVHLSAIGNIIAGDKLYGMTDEEFLTWRNNPDSFKAKLIFPRQALHCSRITFTHPFTNNECSLYAETPDDIKLFIEKNYTPVAYC